MASHCALVERYLQTVWYFCNEYNQADTQKAVQAEPLRGNAVFACGCLFALDLASLNPGITHVCIFDISEKVEKFWADAKRFFEDPQLTYDIAKNSFLSALNLTDYREELELECRYQLSFFSSRERFERIQKIFQSSRFSFARVDLGDPDQVQLFLETQKRQGLAPHAIYTSNIQCAVSGMGNTLEGYEKFRKSMDLLPKSAILIDSVKKPGEIFATQRVTLSGEWPAVAPNYYVMMNALNSDDYEKVMQCIRAGANFHHCDYLGFTVLMQMAAEGKFHSIRALIDGNQADIRAKDGEGLSVLHYCVMSADKIGDPEKTARIIECLVDHGADVNAQDRDGVSPLYQAVALGQTDCARKLLEKGADPSLPNRFGERSLDLLKRRDTPLFSHPDRARELQTLLIGGRSPN